MEMPFFKFSQDHIDCAIEKCVDVKKDLFNNYHTKLALLNFFKRKFALHWHCFNRGTLLSRKFLTNPCGGWNQHLQAWSQSFYLYVTITGNVN